MKAYERFIKYARVHTRSSETTGTHPSTSTQFDLANILVNELKELGLSDAAVDEKCYVYATLPATAGYESATKIGFIAHMDTSPDFSGENVSPVIIPDYDGGDVILGDSGRALRAAEFPHLPALKGRTLITSDGSTLLGADDKAGIAEIMTLLERLISENIPHGQISVSFTPDEEVGEGADFFDVQRFGAEFAYTVDGGPEGEIEYENFNAASAVFEVNGFNIHPGTAKDRMLNAQLIAMEINASLPAGETPRDTEGYEGFYHLCHTEGTVEKATLQYIVRDHDADKFEERQNILRDIEKKLNEKYGDGTVVLTLREQYRNMKEKILPCMHLIENAKAAVSELGLTPRVCPIRGGTDGARLSFMGLPCPNLGTGGYAFHGPYEHITAEGMDIATEILINITRKYANVK